MSLPYGTFSTYGVPDVIVHLSDSKNSSIIATSLADTPGVGLSTENIIPMAAAINPLFC